MTIPMTPVLMALQTQTPRKTFSARSIADGADEIRMILDDFATFNEQENRILQILADLSPEEFVRCLELLGAFTSVEGFRKPKVVSYLERLYEKMNGEEFHALCTLTRSRLIVVKCGGNDQRISAVNRIAAMGATTPEISRRMNFAPTKVTAPSTWGHRSFPQEVEFLPDGMISGKWADYIGYGRIGHEDIRPFRFELTDLAILEHVHVEGKYEIACLFDIKNLSDKQHREFLFTNINLVGIVFGIGMFSAAKGLGQKAVIGLFQVAIPGAGQYVTEHEDEILKMEYGRQFLIAWTGFNILMAAYGGFRLLSSGGGKSALEFLGKMKDELLKRNPASGLVKELARRIKEMLKSFDDVKTNVVDKDVNPSSMNAGKGETGGVLASLKNRNKFHPEVRDPGGITGGKCIATGKTELEMLYEMRNHPNPEKLAVLQHKGDKAFLLIEKAGAEAPKRTDFASCALFSKIIDVFEELDGAKKTFFEGMRLNAQTEIEVGIYKKVLDGKLYYVVMNGRPRGVSPPADNWVGVCHYHPGVPKQAGYRHPAVQDIDIAWTEFRRTGRTQRESIFSFDKTGDIVEIQYGVDADGFFVKNLEGEVRFKDLYPEEIRGAVNEANAFQEPKRTQESVKVFMTLDDNRYYAYWWASHFR